MAKFPRRFLGDLDAAADRDFENHFIASNDLDRILNTDSHIIYGSKGVGKTALRRSLAEINKSRFFATKTIDLDQISFSAVHVALSKLKDTTQTEIPTLARKTWRNLLAIYCLEAVSSELDSSDPLHKRIDQLLEVEGFKGEDSNNRLMAQIERFLTLIAEVGLEESVTATPLGLSRRQRAVVSGFPANPDVESALVESSKRVEASGKYVLVCVDGFDSIVDHTPESRRAIFAGLIDAIYKSSRDQLLAKAFCFKAFLPEELADDAHAIVWDSDKYLLNTHYLRWGESEFQRFLVKRMTHHSRSRSSRFFDLWHEFMPDKVKNEIHGMEEPSFKYILRHTLYRPRQLLVHIQTILDKWDESSSTFRVDPSFIPAVVANTNYELARRVVAQLEIRHPGLGGFLQSWSGRPLTMTVAEFQDRLGKFLVDLKTPQEIISVFDDLYNFGIFGVSLKKPTSRENQQTNFKFAFVGDRFSRNFHTGVDERDLLALSPMFREYSGCTPSECGAVLPVEG